MSSSRRKAIRVRAQVENTESLRLMWGRLPPFYQDHLEHNYGRILQLLNVPVQIEATTCLAQFYDPPLRCFTFQEFQLALTIEEFSQILRSSKEVNGPYRGIGRVAKISDSTTFLDVADLSIFYKGDGEVRGLNRSNL